MVERSKIPHTPLDLPREKPSQQSNASDKLAASFNGPKPKANAPILPSMNGTDCRQRKNSGQNTEAMVRLLNKKNSQMEAPETKTPRNVMTQLRSAFAVTHADQTLPTVAVTAPAKTSSASKRLGIGQANTGDGPNTDRAFFRRSAKVAARPYSIITNSKPCAVNNTDIGPGTSPPPPNGGVAEVTTDTSFAELATKLNAGSLTKLLDIAVVYLSIIKGQACFSGSDVIQLLQKQLAARFDKETG